MDRIGLKRLKRKRKLQGRIKCHGGKSACTHQRKLMFKSTRKVEVRLSWWQRLLKWLNL